MTGAARPTLRAAGLAGVIALASCHTLLGLDDVSYRAAQGGGDQGGQGGSQEGGGGAAPLDGNPRWVLIIDDEEAAALGLPQRGLSCALSESGQAAIALHFEGKVNLNPSPTNGGAPDVIVMTVDEEGDVLRYRDYGDAWEVGASLATLGEDIFVTGPYYGQSLDVGKPAPPLPPACFLDVGQTNCPPDVYSAKYDADLDYRWGRSDGGDLTSEIATAIVTIPPDGVILGGTFNGPVSMFGQSLSHAAALDAFVVRLRDRDTAGTSTEWALSWGGPDNDWLIALDSRAATLAVLLAETVAGDIHGVVRKLNSTSGVEQWDDPPRLIGGVSPRDVAVGPDGSLVVAAVLTAPTMLSTTRETLVPEGSEDLLLLRLSPEGSVDWHKQLAAGGAIADLALAIDDHGDIALGGTFRGSLALGPDHLLEGSDDDLGFLAKLDGEGLTRWSRRFAAPGSEPGTSSVASVAVTAEGETLVVGSFAGTIDFFFTTVTSKPIDESTGAGSSSAAFAMRFHR